MPKIADSTSTVIVHEPPAGSVAPVSSVTEPEAGTAVSAPPQVVDAFGVAATTRSVGNESTSGAVSDIGVAFASPSVIVSVLGVFTVTVNGLNAFATVGGIGSTVSVASAASALMPASVWSAPAGMSLV